MAGSDTSSTSSRAPAPSASVSGHSHNSNSSSSSSSSRLKARKIVVLSLPPAVLSRFPSNASSDDSQAKEEESSSPSTPPAPLTDIVSDGDAASTTNAGDGSVGPAPSTPAAGNAPTSAPASGAAKAGTKRGAAALGPDGLPKPRGKPGPKKKPRLEDGETPSRPPPPAHHRLGPKANQGAINACLRALDRTGKPCRKWERKSFQLKSFTGVLWQVPSWGAPPRPKSTEDEEKKETDQEKKESEKKSEKSEKSTADPDVDADRDETPSGSMLGIESPAPVAVAS
ncbi:hypothetical protein McanMca71_005550 [Microsporum canis]